VSEHEEEEGGGGSHTSLRPFLRRVLTMKSRAKARGGDGSKGCKTTSRSRGSPGTTAQ
jgi:hypothetical protein